MHAKELTSVEIITVKNNIETPIDNYLDGNITCSCNSCFTMRFHKNCARYKQDVLLKFVKWRLITSNGQLIREPLANYNYSLYTKVDKRYFRLYYI